MATAHPSCICFIGSNVLDLKSLSTWWAVMTDRKKWGCYCSFGKKWWFLMVEQHPLQRYKSKKCTFAHWLLWSQSCAHIRLVYAVVDCNFYICWSIYIWFVYIVYISISCVRGVYIITVHLAFLFVLFYIFRNLFFIYLVGGVVGR